MMILLIGTLFLEIPTGYHYQLFIPLSKPYDVLTKLMNCLVCGENPRPSSSVLCWRVMCIMILVFICIILFNSHEQIES